MPIDFPSTPTVGQTYTSASRTWVWSGSTWDAQGTTAGPTGPTGPTGPQGLLGPTGATGAQGISLIFKGTAANPAALPSSGNFVNDAYIVEDTDEVYIWDGVEWINGGNIIGPQGATGPTGAPNVLTVGTVSTGAPASPAAVTITGTSPAQTIDFTIPQGPTGPANTLTVGAVSNGLPGTSPVVSITGTAPAQTISFTIPRGDTGPANVLSIGTVSTLAADEDATATITGTSPAQTLNLGLPLGATGPATVLSIGTVSNTGPDGTAAVTVTGTAPAQTLNFTLKQGPTGPANTLTVGTVTQGGPDTTPVVTISGTAPNQTIDFTLQRGPTGPTGPTGYVTYADATARDVAWPTPVDGYVTYLQDVDELQVRVDGAWETITIDSDSGILTSGIVAQANWTLTSQTYRLRNGVCQFRIQAQRTTTDLVIPANGNLGNAPVATMPAGFRPFMEAIAGGGSIGPIVSGFVETDGDINIAATAPGVTIAVGDSVSLVGTFLV